MTTSTASPPKSSVSKPSLSDHNKVKVGSFFNSFVTGTVVSIKGRNYNVRTTEGGTFTIEGHELVDEQFAFADQHEQVLKVSQTEMIEALMNAPRCAMTVNFNKQPDEGEVAKTLAAGQGTDSDRVWKSKVKLAMEGEERTMIGYHERSLDDRGRLKFYESGTGFRLVDPRRLNWLVVNRVRYEIK